MQPSLPITGKFMAHFTCQHKGFVTLKPDIPTF